MLRNRKIWSTLLIGVVVSISAYFIIALSPDASFYLSASWIIVVAILLWLGNRLITRLLNKHFPWLTYGRTRFFSHLTIGIIYSLVIINVAYFLFKAMLTVDPPTPEQIVVMNVYGVVIFIPFFSIYFSLHFLSHWRESALAAEKFQKENIQAQLSSLKNHLDPHFLFNNLNILSSLIDKDKNMSKSFLDKFAEVYRGLLKSKDEDLIPLGEEILLMESYIYLIKTRFEENIQFDIKVDKALDDFMIPPLTIQMLIENAIKHNFITERKALKISIHSVGDQYLEVSNSLNVKPEDNMVKSGSGLDNIKKRYQHFTDMPVIINEADDKFVVSIPLLEIESV